MLMRPDFLTSSLCTVEKSLLLIRASEEDIKLDWMLTEYLLSVTVALPGFTCWLPGPHPVFVPVHVHFGVEPVHAGHEFVLFFLTPKLIGHTAPFLV